jgi:hypothetical protein
MRAKKLAGIALATAAAGMFAVTVAGEASAAQASLVKCVGVNACKGQSACQSAGNSCKGLNECKGKGFLEMTQADCDKAKMALKK